MNYYGKKANTVRRVLLDGPTTSSELAASLKWKRTLAAAWLNVLVKQGHAVAAATVVTDQRKHKLYSLTPRGIAVCRNHLRDTMRAHQTEAFPPAAAKVISKVNGLSTRTGPSRTISLGETPWLSTHSPTWPEG